MPAEFETGIARKAYAVVSGAGHRTLRHKDEAMELTWSAEQEAFRLSARAWLERNLREWRAGQGGDILSGDTAAGFVQHLQWERLLFAGGWSAVSWAPEHGGRGASLWEWLLFEEEYYRAGAPQRVTQNGIFLLAPSIYEFGTKEQRDGILPRMARAEHLWCQGWSEPGAGSDLASVTSTARRVHGGWLLNGQKTWTTRGAFCTHLFGLFRSDPGSSRHHGLTYLLMPLDVPGVTVRGFGRLDGDEGFADVYFSDAFLPDDAVPGGVALGAPGSGWAVAMATTGSERGLTLRSPGRFLSTVDRLRRMLAEWAPEDPVLRRRVADAWMKAEAYQLHTLQTVTRLAEGGRSGPEASLGKLWWSELDVELHEIALDLLGAEAELDGPWSRGWQFSLSGPIYAGTNEIQRNIAAERILGLPR